MSRSSDPKKLAMWERRFQRFSNSGLAVTQFCFRERVSVASFYHWRKKLGPETPPRRTAVRGDVFQRVTVLPAASGVSIQLPGGTQIEVRTEHLDAIRAVIAEAARVDRCPEAEASASPPGSRS
jgi:hypothetical protein